MIKLSEKLQIPVLQIGSRVIPNSNVSKFPMRVEPPLRAKIWNFELFLCVDRLTHDGYLTVGGSHGK
jgi:hypothetical protein